jgi:hypothetical protein
MHRRIVLLIAALAFLVLVVAVSTATALTPTTTSTIALPLIRKDSTPTPTPTPPTFSDDFSNPSSGWPVNEDSISKVGYLGGEYQILVKQGNYIVRAGNNYQASDFQVELDARDAGSVDGSVGMYFGSVTNVGFYDFEVAYGQFDLIRYDLTNINNSQTLINPTVNSAIQSGNASNHLKATRSGSTITLFANGTQLAQISDSTLGFGFVGLAATAFLNNFDARFDNFYLVEAAPQHVRASGAGPADLENTAPLPALRSGWLSIPR